MATAEDVAKWMMEQVEQRYMYQDTIVYQIRSQFGEQFTYVNENGNLAIGKDVLKAFKKLSGDSVIWERGDRCWRKRRPYDRPGRQQD